MLLELLATVEGRVYGVSRGGEWSKIGRRVAIADATVLLARSASVEMERPIVPSHF